MKNFFNALSAMFAAIWSILCAFLPIGNIKITVEPAVFDFGTEYYCVVWETSTKGSGYVKYNYNGEEKIIRDEKTGLIKTDDTVHSVLVPKEELQNNTYKVGSQYVGFKYGYSAAKGKSTESKEYHFNGVPKNDDIKILCVSDIHGLEDLMRKSLTHFPETPDLVVMLGDITSELTTKEQFTEQLLADAAELSGGSAPVIYVRGNHETRGEFGAQMIDYFSTQTGEFYYTFEFGSLGAIILDSGEDKEDSNEGYDGLINFEDYRNKEYEWLSSLDGEVYADKDYKLVFSHISSIDNFFGKDWTAPLKEMGADLLVSGHSHKSAFLEKELPVFIDGGKLSTESWAASMITLKDSNITLRTVDNNGNVLLDKTIPA